MTKGRRGEGLGNFSDNALRVLERRYLRREGGVLMETPEEMLRRVAKTMAEVEKNYRAAEKKAREDIEEEFYQMMYELEFLPNSPTLMNAGRELGQLSACFVLPVDDSLDSIFETIKHTAKIHQSGGGTGFSFSRLRPKDDIVATTGGVASGPVSFMKVFNAATEAIKQGGTRRGANMGILRVDHPDILEFIQCKRSQTDLTNFNISVAVTDEFMQKVEADEEYELINRRTGQVEDKRNARTVFDLIAAAAWECGDPGVVFIDRINEANPTPKLGEIESTNPCGEQPLLPYESCNLGSINLARFIKRVDDKAEIDYPRLEKCVGLAVHFLDNVIDANRYPLKEIEAMTKGNRKIGLGIMGFADLLIELNIPYDSKQAEAVARELILRINKAAWDMSEELAKKRGPFPNFRESELYKGIQEQIPGELIRGKSRKSRTAPESLPLSFGYQFRTTTSPSGFRNSTVITIAPTGTIAILADCSSGIEPLFALAYTRVGLDNQKFIFTNHLFEKKAKELGFYNLKLMEKIAQLGGCQGLAEVPEEVQRVFLTAMEIEPEWHIKMQAAFQQFTDNAVSKTLNLRNEATVEDVKEIYKKAYKEGCKGVTIYRDGSRQSQVLSIARKEEEKGEAVARVLVPRYRPKLTYGRTERIKTGCGNLYVTINEDERGLCEVFINIGKGGGCASAEAEAIGRLVSLALRARVEPAAIIKHLRGVRCPQPFWDEGELILSCPDAIGRALERFIKEKEGKGEEGQQPLFALKDEGARVGACPECGSMVEHEGGCVVCRLCGFNRCG